MVLGFRGFLALARGAGRGRAAVGSSIPGGPTAAVAVAGWSGLGSNHKVPQKVVSKSRLSLAEPEVRIHLPPAESQRRTRAPTIAEETLSAHPVPRVVALLGLIGVSDDATAALDQTAVRRRNRPFANRRVRSKVAAGCSFQRIPSALLIGILRERGIGQCHRTHKRTRSRNPRRLYKASAGLSGNT